MYASIVRLAGETPSHVLCAQFHSRHVQPSTLHFRASHCSLPLSCGMTLNFSSSVPNLRHSNNSFRSHTQVGLQNKCVPGFSRCLTIIPPLLLNPSSMKRIEVDLTRLQSPPRMVHEYRVLISILALQDLHHPRHRDFYPVRVTLLV